MNRPILKFSLSTQGPSEGSSLPAGTLLQIPALDVSLMAEIRANLMPK